MDKNIKNNNKIEEHNITLSEGKSSIGEKIEGYREMLAKFLKKKRNQGKKNSDLYEFLEKERQTNKYIESSRDGSLSKKLAFNLIENEKGDLVVRNIKKFKPSDHKEIADLLIEKGYYYELGENLNNFEGLNHKHIVKKIIEKSSNRDKVDDFFKGINYNIGGLDKEIAKLLIEKSYSLVFINNLKLFVELDKEIAKLLIEEKEGYKQNILSNLKSFKGLDKSIFISIYDNYREHLIKLEKNFDSFEGLDTEVVKIIIEKIIEDEDYIEYHEECIKNIATGLNSFEGLDKEIADFLIKKGYIEDVAQNLNCFKNLDEEIKNILIKEGYDLYVEMYSDSFEDKKLQG